MKPKRNIWESPDKEYNEDGSIKKEASITIQGLWPLDFKDSHFPFSYYSLRPNNDNIEIIGVDDGDYTNYPGDKPDDAKVDERADFDLFRLSWVAPKFTEEDYRIFKEQKILEGWKTVIFKVTHGIDIKGDESYIEDGKIDKQWAEFIYFNCKDNGGIEPYVYVFGEDGVAAGYNPKRWSFNTLIRNTGISYENDRIEKQNLEQKQISEE